MRPGVATTILIAIDRHGKAVRNDDFMKVIGLFFEDCGCTVFDSGNFDAYALSL